MSACLIRNTLLNVYNHLKQCYISPRVRFGPATTEGDENKKKKTLPQLHLGKSIANKPFIYFNKCIYFLCLYLLLFPINLKNRA